MNYAAFLYTILSVSGNEKASGKIKKDMDNIYRDAFQCAMDLNIPCIMEGDTYILFLFNEVFKLSKAKPTSNPYPHKNETNPQSAKKNEILQNDIPIIEDISGGVPGLFKRRMKTAPLSETPAVKQEENESVESPADEKPPDPYRIRCHLRDIHTLKIKKYEYDTNTEARTLKRTEELLITIYPMNILENSVSAPITAVIENASERNIYTVNPGDANSLICKFNDYTFILRGLFEKGNFISSVTPHEDTADRNIFEITEDDVISERPEKGAPGHCSLKIGKYEEHLFPLQNYNDTNQLCPFFLINEYDGKREVIKTKNRTFIIIELGDQKYQIYTSWIEDGFEGKYKNITSQMNGIS